MRADRLTTGGVPSVGLLLGKALYVAETSWKYNERKNPNTFATFLRGVFS